MINRSLSLNTFQVCKTNLSHLFNYLNQIKWFYHEKKEGSMIKIPRRRFLGVSPEVEKAVREIIEENITEYFNVEFDIRRK